MNILLNNYCNLSCEYCFAGNVLKEQRQDISLEGFRKCLQLLPSYHPVSILGGEPTLHPQFPEILDILQKDLRTRVLLFTNGTFKESILELIIQKCKLMEDFTVFINFNHPDIIGSKNYQRIKHNIKELIASNVGIVIRVNIYKPYQDFEYVYKICEEFQIKVVSQTICVPKDKMDVKEYFAGLQDTMVDFVDHMRAGGVRVMTDCNTMPQCLLPNLGPQYCNHGYPCTPVIDIKPDLTAIRCFGHDSEAVSIEGFASIDELMKHYIENVDLRIRGNKKVLDECNSCGKWETTKQSCVCLKFIA